MSVNSSMSVKFLRLTENGLIEFTWNDGYRLAINLSLIVNMEMTYEGNDIALFTVNGNKLVIPGVSYHVVFDIWNDHIGGISKNITKKLIEDDEEWPNAQNVTELA